MTYGSTTLAVREAVRISGLDCRIVQPVYLEPFPYWAIDRFCGGPPPVIVEQSSTGMFAKLLSEKLGLEPRRDQLILKYDGRPFDPEELASRLKEAI
jgi:2-oxoglutarate ferredoxin oxidoreductase subunit alpha